MTNIRITEGTYGNRPDGVNLVPVHMGECVDVEDQEAERLIRLGVAERTEEPVATAPEQLEAMKVAELKELAADMGIEIPGRATKADLIKAIAAEPVTPGPAEDAPPALSADSPV